jgi:hypothetical protein
VAYLHQAPLKKVNLMATSRVFRSILLAAGVLAMAGCASRPEGSLLETKFQRAANSYDYALPYQGTTVYCNRGATRSLPLDGCVTETQLRAQVENAHMGRGTASGRSPPAGVGQGMIGNMSGGM